MILLCLDLDGTLWDNDDVSALALPFKRINRDSFIDRNGVIVSLFPGVRDFLKETRQLPVIISTLSWNKFKNAYEALKVLDIAKYFDYILVEYHPRKDKMLLKLLSKIKRERKIEIKPESIIYVDDNEFHIADIRRDIGQVKFFHMWHDLKDFSELLEYIKRIIS